MAKYLYSTPAGCPQEKAGLNRRQWNTDLSQWLPESKICLFCTSLKDFSLPVVINFLVVQVWMENILLVTWKERTVTSWSKSHWCWCCQRRGRTVLEMVSCLTKRPTIKHLCRKGTWERGINSWRCDFCEPHVGGPCCRWASWTSRAGPLKVAGADSGNHALRALGW